jgi:hypothetical protein
MRVEVLLILRQVILVEVVLEEVPQKLILQQKQIMWYLVVKE